MASVQEQAVYTFSTSSGGQTYRYDIVVDSQGNVSARNFRTATGLIQDSFTSLPELVLQDIAAAKDTINQLVAEAEAASGTVTFSGQSTRPASVAPGLLNNTNYRVAYTTPDGMYLWTSAKTTTGFLVEAPAVYGTVDDPIDVDFSVLVTTAQGSTTGGSVSILAADGGVKTITFPVAMTTDQYRVLISPDGPWQVTVVNQTKAGFTLQVGYTMALNEVVTVGYDIFL